MISLRMYDVDESKQKIANPIAVFQNIGGLKSWPAKRILVKIMPFLIH